MSESELLVIVPIHHTFMATTSAGVCEGENAGMIDDEIRSSKEETAKINPVFVIGANLTSNSSIEMSSSDVVNELEDSKLEEIEERSRSGRGCCRGERVEDDELDVIPYQILTCPERCVSGTARWLKRMSGLWFAHFFLLSILMCYTTLGAFIFLRVEADHELAEKHEIKNHSEELLAKLWNLSQYTSNKTEWTVTSQKLLYYFEKELEDWYKMGFSADPEKKLWSFWGAMFYCGTVYSSIGYGHIIPSTTAGRALTMVYATFGIPLLLMVLADFGKLFTRGIKFLYSLVHRFYHTESCKKFRRAGVIQATVKVIKRQSQDEQTTYVPSTTKNINNCNYDCREEMEINRENQKYQIDDEFDLPVIVAVTLLIGYIMLGALMFNQWEVTWSFFEAFYFVFISMSTIGFGDFVPEHPIFMMGTFVYLLFGLALTSMCINVIQEWLTKTFKKASSKLSAHMGIEARERPSTANTPQMQEVNSKVIDFQTSLLKRKGE